MIPENPHRDSTIPASQSSAPAAPLAEAELREALKRCSASTYTAACEFRRTGEIIHVAPIVRGVIERYVEPDLRGKFQNPDPALRLCEDLGLDSLSMMEIVLLAEEVLGISITHEELRQLHTLGEVQHFMECKLRGAPLPSPRAGSL
ncbi:MAG: phosphopantetheine-binding protein [Opitutaceae bacterium]|nr:phosphopantetheine-binding protein [Opitutaceae bacterium]